MRSSSSPRAATSPLVAARASHRLRAPGATTMAERAEELHARDGAAPRRRPRGADAAGEADIVFVAHTGLEGPRHARRHVACAAHGQAHHDARLARAALADPGGSRGAGGLAVRLVRPHRHVDRGARRARRRAEGAARSRRRSGVRLRVHDSAGRGVGAADGTGQGGRLGVGRGREARGSGSAWAPCGGGAAAAARRGADAGGAVAGRGGAPRRRW